MSANVWSYDINNLGYVHCVDIYLNGELYTHTDCYEIDLDIELFDSLELRQLCMIIRDEMIDLGLYVESK